MLLPWEGFQGAAGPPTAAVASHIGAVGKKGGVGTSKDFGVSKTHVVLCDFGKSLNLSEASFRLESADKMGR